MDGEDQAFSVAMLVLNFILGRKRRDAEKAL